MAAPPPLARRPHRQSAATRRVTLPRRQQHQNLCPPTTPDTSRVLVQDLRKVCRRRPRCVSDAPSIPGDDRVPNRALQAQWSTHPLLTTGDSGVWMPDGTFSPPHVQASPYREDSGAPAVLPQGKLVAQYHLASSITTMRVFTDLHHSKQAILGSGASPIPIAAHAMNHSTMNFQPNLTHGSSINPVTYTYSTFREGKRQARADGESDQKVFGQRENDIHALLSGETDFDPQQPLSVWAPRVANVFFHGVAIPERLAACEILKEVMMVWVQRHSSPAVGGCFHLI